MNAAKLSDHYLHFSKKTSFCSSLSYQSPAYSVGDYLRKETHDFHDWISNAGRAVNLNKLSDPPMTVCPWLSTQA